MKTKAIVLKHWPASWAQREWTPTDGDLKCSDCDQRNPRWWVEPALWERIMGGETGSLCPTCFLARCDNAGIGRSGAWQLYPPASLL